MPQGTIKKLRAGQVALNKCTARVGRKFDSAYKAIERANITERTRENRFQQLDDKASRQTHRACQVKVKHINAIVGKIVNNRKRQREALAKRVAAHLAKIK